MIYIYIYTAGYIKRIIIYICILIVTLMYTLDTSFLTTWEETPTSDKISSFESPMTKCFGVKGLPPKSRRINDPSNGPIQVIGWQLLHGTAIMVSFAIPMVENTTKHDSCLVN